MANSVTAKKEHRKMLKRYEINKSRKTVIKTFIKKFNQAIDSGDCELSLNCFRVVQPKIHKAVSMNIFSKNKAANVISSLSKKVKKLCLAKQV